MGLTAHDFSAFHEAVHGRPAFSWQVRLLEQVVSERAWPQVLDLPTGAGKTTCIDVALFALALDAEQSERWCPRRIAMVVDRRVVVDQVAERGRRLRQALVASTSHPLLQEVARRLRFMSAAREEPVAVFTLRGGIPKDDGWARTPDQPLILASTVDQLGSRLLMQGYGVSRGMKPVHAGLLGNDLLLLLDEVHLSQAFADTLRELAEMRRRFERTSLLAPRFHHAFLSATPGSSGLKTFRLLEADKAPASPLYERLHASKAARPIDEPDRGALETRCIDESRRLIERHSVIAVVVNRVGSASSIARRLARAFGDAIDVRLLTGRMRPLDRDDVVRDLRARIETGRDRNAVLKKLIVVGTQCIEAGADFDFDALVTEAASLDALRQRFGRVDRLGLYGQAEGVIVRDQSAKDDPVYGEALNKTAVWIKERLAKKTKSLDFGVMSLPTPSPSELPDLVAPKPRAPVLLPAYLDLWVQTSPAPDVLPEVSLWLHGPRSGPADVQVLWRADLSEGDLLAASTDGNDAAQTIEARDRVTAIVASVRPSSLETVSLPFVAARRWLAGESFQDIADVEKSEPVEDDDEPRGRTMLAFRWRGEESEVIKPDALRPGDTIVVPASRGGLHDRCFDPKSSELVVDLAERAALFGRGLPVLRMHPSVLAQHGLTLPEETEEARNALGLLAEESEPGWKKAWLSALATSRGVSIVEGNDSWPVLQGKRLSPTRLRSILDAEHDTLEDGIELTTDDDDSYYAGRSVPLAEHSVDVELFAREFGQAIGLPKGVIEDLALAGWLHDVGKADRRFQVMLRGGSEIELFKDETVLAKSGMLPSAKAAHRLAQRRSRYPRGARHEMQSLAMVSSHLEAVRAKAGDIDLVLHLVASHHGHGRPFAPVVPDPDPVDVTLRGHESKTFGVIDFTQTSSDHGLHRLDSPLADRFWRLVERYGWLELCWLEAILRLADHRASEAEQTSGGVA